MENLETTGQQNAPVEGALTEQQILENNTAILADMDPPHKSAAPAAQEKPAETQTTQTQETGSLKYKDVWEGLEKKGLKIPDEIKQGKFQEGVDEFDALQQAFAAMVKIPELEDPFIQGYINTPPEERSSFVASYNAVEGVLKMDADAGLKYVYQQEKNEKGERRYTDEEIEDDLKSRSKLQKDREWNELKAKINESRQPKQPTEAEILSAISEENARRMKILEPIMAEEDGLNEIYGIPYTPEMKESFKNAFSVLNSINKKTGNPIIYDFLNDNNNLKDVIRAYALTKDNKLSAYLSDFKEDYKEKIIDSLDLKGKPKSGSSVFAKPPTPDDFS